MPGRGARRDQPRAARDPHALSQELEGPAFRRGYSRLVAALARRAGYHELPAVEDAVGAALVEALERWGDAPPADPWAWLYRVSLNRLLDELRQRARRERLLARAAREPAPEPPRPDPDEVGDDLLRMLFVCCEESIPRASQLVLALKVLCGFSVAEIGPRLFLSEANVYKRLTRARARLRERSPTLELSPSEAATRLPAVLEVLYLLFSEGYLSARPELAIRRELCEEALRLTALVVEHPLGQAPEAYALRALMHLHLARLDARQDPSGGLLLLEEQDRTRWEAGQVEAGLRWLARSAEGQRFSRYHAEAGIAAEHCLAPSFAQTRWERVVACYELLEQVAPSALHRLNRAVALAEWRGAAAGLELLEGAQPPTWLEGSYLWAAVLSDLHRRQGDAGEAARYRARALETAPTPAIGELLRRRLGAEGPGG